MKYVDLFAGCGGLSLGIERAGGELVVAVEKSDMAARTFHHNLIGDASDPVGWDRYAASPVTEQVQAGLVVRELSALLSDDDAMDGLAAEKLDLVVGGPPCQGFSLAGRRNPDDVRNKLPWEYLQFVERTGPKAVIIENVVGMNRRFDNEEESSFLQLQQALAETEPGYVVQGVHVNAMHYGAPQHRPRLMIIALRADIAADRGITSTGLLWRSDFTDAMQSSPAPLAPIPTVARGEVRTVADAIADLSPYGDRTGAGNTHYVGELRQDAWNSRHGSTDRLLNHVPRKHQPRTKDRFRLYQYLAGCGQDQRIVSQVANLSASDARLLVKTRLAESHLPAVSTDETVIATTLEELTDLVLSLATRKHSQKVLNWDQPARTVVTLPDDYVHPAEPRIFTVRELARFQGFPEGFEFLGKETTGAHRRRLEVPQYSQVGNAVSPWLSWAAGKRISEIVGGQELNEESK